MEIQVIARGAPVDGEQLRERLKRQLQRLAWWVAHVRLRFADVNGPRGGPDKECQLELQTRQGQQLRVRARAGVWEVAFAHALERLTRSLGSLHARKPIRPRRRKGASEGGSEPSEFEPAGAAFTRRPE